MRIQCFEAYNNPSTYYTPISYDEYWERSDVVHASTGLAFTTAETQQILAVANPRRYRRSQGFLNSHFGLQAIQRTNQNSWLLFKDQDEYYYVMQDWLNPDTLERELAYYRCDQFTGLLQYLTDHQTYFTA